jgi:hypothetical protein
MDMGRLEKAKSMEIPLDYDKDRFNRIGFGLYITGERDSDKFVGPSDFDENWLKIYKVEDEPKLGGLVRLKNKSSITKHLSVVTGLNPTRVTHRTCTNGYIEENRLLNEVMAVYSGNFLIHLEKEYLAKI